MKSMNRNEFLACFAHLADNELNQLRRSEALRDWSREQGFYLALAKEFFHGGEDDCEECLERQRFVRILQEKIYTDDRSFQALLWIAQEAYRHPDLYGGNGLNALAGISAYLARKPPISDTGREYLVRLFESFLSQRYLENNSRRCLEALAECGQWIDEDSEDNCGGELDQPH
jgi:hypothetical protein